MRRSHLLVLWLALACSSPTDSGSDRPSLARASSGPTVTSADPSGAPQDTTLDIHVLGSGFDKGSKVAFARDGVVDPKLRVNGTQYRTGGELIANVTVAADAETVAYDVLVTTSSGKKGIGTELFAVEVPFETLAAPTGSSNVWDASPTGMVTGTIGTTCGPGFAPALWDLSRSLVPLPALTGTCGGVADAANGGGVVVGAAYIGSSQALSVRWSPGPSGYTVEQLPTLPNGKRAGASSINDSGWIGAWNEAAVYIDGIGWQLLAWPVGASSCFYTAIGNGGQAAAQCKISNVVQGGFWAALSAMPTILPAPPSATGVYPRAVTASGVVVGWAIENTYTAIRWTPSGSSWTITRLPDLGKGGSALAGNDAGYVVGSVIGNNGWSVPAFWTPEGALHLLSSGGNSGEAVGISEAAAGLVIAGYYNGKGGKHAVRWRP